MPLSELIASLGSNPYFSAGFGLVGVGAGLAVLRKGSLHAYTLFRRYAIITLEVPSNDKSYQWNIQNEKWKKYSTVSHVIMYCLFFLHDLKSGKIISNGHPLPFRYFGLLTVHLYCLREYVGNICIPDLADNRGYFKIPNEGPAVSFCISFLHSILHLIFVLNWLPLFFNLLTLLNVLLLSLTFIQCCFCFFLGIPYRRGYLLYGPPGCGKSSFIQALAGELDYSICVMNLSDRSLSDDRLIHLMSCAPQQSIVLLEDIDAAFVKRTDEKEEGKAYSYPNRVTFSGLLNTLDGVASSEERLVFMTTNHLDRLDPALIRPGRVDLKQEIGLASKSQLYKMYRRFYPDQTFARAEEFADKVMGLGQRKSIAHIQGHFMLFKNDPSGAIQSIEL
ncbi:unnamed protein product, partial [Porites evermanni]